MDVFLRAISYYLPEATLTNEQLAREFPEWDVDKVYNKVGVWTRHLAGKDETAGDLAEKAARKLFEEYEVSPLDIDFVLLCRPCLQCPSADGGNLYEVPASDG